MKLKWSSGSIELDKESTLQKCMRSQIAAMLCGLAQEIEESEIEVRLPVTGTITTEIQHWDALITLEVEWPETWDDCKSISEESIARWKRQGRPDAKSE